ncbi:phospholipase B [Hyphopichia burtonii NRRL Y-1933]|uniref:Lysophospholipase n=1 Tax=Hyphopichia burtonii NRRL Y-1933 TaxID=984485 RepID=A0A1E4RIW3_9ASCO|nr:phospholipase B [Hyphopichia burtonii NRRL Y-1933]ODV67193.1 phospholipase B [Hyphopichia burtonii NRRL Y-1933]
MKFQILILSFLVTCLLAWSPTDSYAPGKLTCPNNKDLIREADSLSQDEKDWINGRNKVTDKNLISFLEWAKMDDFNATDFINNKANRSIHVGLSFSGGGYRAMLAGAGALSALDNRTKGASKSGLGGLLQASTYLTGLSGGNWLTGTISMNNFTSVQKILDDGKIWDLEHSIMNVGGWNAYKTYKYYKALYDDIHDKEDAGYEVSITDTWGRALSHQFFAQTENYGSALCWSDLQNYDQFKNHEMPFPISVADGRVPGTSIISGNSTVFEMNPFEFGSWDPSLNQFTQTKYLGTTVKDGENNGTCIGGFDNAGFIMGTSSSLFNQFILQINTTSLSSTIKSLVHSILQDVSNDDDDIAVYKPNPFYKSDLGESVHTINNDTLYLCDGGEDLQNVPLYPLLQRDRQVDVIFAYDNSADTDESWPNGTSLVASYERQFLNEGNGTLFPYVPDQRTFRNLNLTAKPAFFGCEAKNLTSLLKRTNQSNSDTSIIYDTPLIVYNANRPFTYWSNTSTFKMSYDEKEKRGMIKNGFEVASRLNQSLDKDWPACVGCAIIRREQERQGIEQSDQCKKCFDKYCWDGTIDDSTPGINFTTSGTTNGNEDNGNRTVSAAMSLVLRGNNAYELMKLTGYAMLASIIFCVSF